MKFWRSPWGAAVLATATVVGLAAAAMLGAVHHATRPAERERPSRDTVAFVGPVEDVAFRSTDGLALRGWWIASREGRPAIVLCHDRGATRSSLSNLALALHDAGFGVLLFDFRGHGTSAAARSTLGLHEKRDVQGAVDHLAALPGAGDPARIGVYGVGMGAYAAVLAAANRPRMKVLVLDGLYPDVDFELGRALGSWSDWSGLRPVRRLAFAALGGVDPADDRATSVVGALEGREVLFLSPAADPPLAVAIERMYRSVPLDVHAEGNLVVLPSLIGEGLYGAELDRYHARVVDFFRSRLAGP